MKIFVPFSQKLDFVLVAIFKALPSLQVRLNSSRQIGCEKVDFKKTMKLVPETSEESTLPSSASPSSPSSTSRSTSGRNGVKLGIVRLGKAGGKVGT